MKSLRLPFASVAGTVFILLAAFLPAFAVEDRVQASADLRARVALEKSVSTRLAYAADAGRLAAGQKLGRIMLTLAPTHQQVKDADTLIRQLHDRHSANYHKWMTASQFGDKFGISPNDAAQVKKWMESQGLTVHEVSQSRRFVTFSGNVGQVEAAFGTELHSYMRNGHSFIANARPVQVPAALKPVIASVGLTGHVLHSDLKIGKHEPFDIHSGAKGLTSFSDGAHYLAPADWAAIYDVSPAWQAGITGANQQIAIVGRSNINVDDVNSFRALFGLPSNPPNIIVNGDDPGETGDVIEAILDVEWSGAIAPQATVNFVVSQSNFDDGVSVSSTYIVDHMVAPVMSTSYGECEDALGTGGNFFTYLLGQQAAAEGITAMVSSGDNGGAGCDDPNAGTLASGGFAVSGLASTPYTVTVGGLEFEDSANPSQYWTLFNGPGLRSAIGYMPEMVWNETSNDPNSVSIWAGSGGVSTWWNKPDWQVAPGVPNDGARDLPDVSFTAAGHDGYLIYYAGGLYSVGGTSASSPSFAGVMALVNQATGSPQGQANYVLYPLFRGANSAAIFHDTVDGNNMVPDTTGAFTVGYPAATGYDLASGLGSIDVAQLINHWADNSAGFLASQTALTMTCSTGSTCNTFPHGYQDSNTQDWGIAFQSTVTPATSGPTPTGATVMVAVLNTLAPTGSSTSASTPGPGKMIRANVAQATSDSCQPTGNTMITGGNDILTSGAAQNFFQTLPGNPSGTVWCVYAQYSGDVSYNGSTSPAFAINVTPEDSTTTIAPLTGGWQVFTPVQLQYGEAIPISIVVAGNSGLGYPSGSVSIIINGSSIGTSTLQYGETGLTQQSSTIFTLQGFSAGTYTLASAYPGDASFNASTSNTYTLNVSKAATYIYNFGSVGTILPNTPVTFSGYVGLNNPGSGAMDGTVNLVEMSNPSSPVTLASNVTVNSDGSFSAPVTFATAGTYHVQAQFLGSENLLPSSYMVKKVVAAQASTTTTIATTTSAVVAGGAATYTANVSSQVANRVPTGTVTFTSSSGSSTQTLGSATLDANGNTTLTTNALLISGAFNVNATYGGDTYFTGSTSSTSVTTQVSSAPTTLTLTSSAASIVTGSSVTFTATLGAAFTGCPTGTVTYYDGTASLGTSTFNCSTATVTAQTPGSAGQMTTTFTASSLALGSHAIQAMYGGDQTFSGSTSNAVSELVTGPPSYAVSVNPSVLTIKSGQTGTATFTVYPENGFNQKITFACASLPTNASCSFNPATVTPDGSNAPVTSTLTVSTSVQQGASLHRERWMTGGSVIAFAGVLCALPFGMRRRRWGLALLLAVIAMVAFAASCGSSSGVKAGDVQPGNYNVTVQATVSGGGTQTGALTIIVTK